MGATAEDPSLLAGLIYDAVNSERLTPTHAKKGSKRYRYYVSATSTAAEPSTKAAAPRRIPAGDIEGLVLDQLHCFLADPKRISDAVAPLNLNAPQLEALLNAATNLSQRWRSLLSNQSRIFARQLIVSVAVGDEQISISLDLSAIASALGVEPKPSSPHLAPIMLMVEAQLKRSGKGKRLIIENGAPLETNSGIADLIKEAFSIRSRFFPDRPAIASRP